jgi:hypothetical protein
MRFGLLVLIAIFGLTLAANAQTRVNKYDADTINSSIKCELAQAQQLFRRNNVDARRLRAYVTITGEETTFTKVGVEGGFFVVRGRIAYERKITRLRGAKGERNIHPANNVNCRKSFVVDVGILSCFREQRTLFLENQTITCSETTTATASAGAGGQFAYWVLNVGPSGEVAKTRSWKIDLVAPPDK